MDTNKMKSTFLFNEHETPEKMLEFIRNDLGVTEADIWNYIGYDIIIVPYQDYEHVLIEGKKYARQKNWGMWWVDHYNDRRGPVASIDIAYGLLPKNPIPGEEKVDYSYRRFWFDDKYTPPYLQAYLNEMKDYLKVEKLFRDYHYADDALTLAPLSLDYEEILELMKEFINEYGYGPFRKIHPKTITGEFIKEPFKVKRRGQKKNF